MCNTKCARNDKIWSYTHHGQILLIPSIIDSFTLQWWPITSTIDTNHNYCSFHLSTMIIHQNFINTPSHHYPMYATPITKFDWWWNRISLEILTVFWSLTCCVTQPITVSVETYIEKMWGNSLNTILNWLYIIRTGHGTNRYLSTSICMIV